MQGGYCSHRESLLELEKAWEQPIRDTQTEICFAKPQITWAHSRWCSQYRQIHFCSMHWNTNSLLLEHGAEITVWLELEGISGDHPAHPAVQTDSAIAGCPGLHSDEILISPGMKTQQHLLATCATAWSASQESSFKCWNGGSHLPDSVHCLCSCHRLLLRRAACSFPSPMYLYTMIRYPPSYSIYNIHTILNSPRSLGLSSYNRCFSTFVPHHCIHICLTLGHLDLDPALTSAE